MTNLKLTYFDFDGGRGEAARLALVLGNVAFEDDRVSFDRWQEIKGQQPYGALPTLYVDGAPIAQSNAISRYVGKLSGLYPSDPLQAAMCDETLETIEELTTMIGATIHVSDEEKKAKREVLVAERLPIFLKGLERRLKANGGQFFTGERLTVADLRTYDFIQWLRSGILDHIPADFVERTAPALVQHCEMIKNEPRVKAYYENRAKQKN